MRLEEQIHALAKELEAAEDGFYSIGSVYGTKRIYKREPNLFGIQYDRWIAYESAYELISDIVGLYGGLKLHKEGGNA